MASAYTRSCSNDNTLDKGCFGLTHFEERYWCILWIYISCGLIGVEILLYLLYILVGKLKYRAAVKASEANTADPLLNASVYACLFKPFSNTPLFSSRILEQGQYATCLVGCRLLTPTA